MALKINSTESPQSPSFNNQFGNLIEKNCDFTIMKSPKPNSLNATTKQLNSLGCITFWLFSLVGIAASAPTFHQGPSKNVCPKETVKLPLVSTRL